MKHKTRLVERPAMFSSRSTSAAMHFKCDGAEEKMRLIPVWLDVSREDVADFNPSLADVFAIQGNVSDINSCAMEVLRVVRPRLHENISMLSGIEAGKVKITNIPRTAIRADVRIRHHDLDESLLVRIQNIWFAIRDVSTCTF